MRRLLWLTVAALLTAGCSTASGRQAGDAQPHPRPLNGALHLTAAEATVLHAAEERRVRICMRERGFTYRTVPADDAGRSAAAGPYGLLAVAQAARDGYGLTSRRLDGPPKDPNEEHLASLSEAGRGEWNTALKGDPEGTDREKVVLPDGPTVTFDPESCVHLAQQRLYGDGWTRDHYLFQSLRNQVVRDTLGRPAVRKAERAWASCMQAAGFDHRSRSDAAAAVRERVRKAGDGEALRAAGALEMRTAKQDAACQAEVALADRIAAAQERVEDALPENRTSGLDDFRAARQKVLADAAQAAERDTES